MEKVIIDGVAHYKKKNKPRPSKDKYYEPLYNTPDCPYKGKKRGRKSQSELDNLPKLTVTKGNYIMYFD